MTVNYLICVEKLCCNQDGKEYQNQAGEENNNRGSLNKLVKYSKKGVISK
jgi:hypothetical protein